MTISNDMVITIALALFGFIFGALWGHHSAIEKRVKFSDCVKLREKCVCTENLRELKEEIKSLQ